MRHLLTAAQLDASEVADVLARADELSGGTEPGVSRPLLGTLFLTPSMRTRVGFAAAAHRLGGSSVSVEELRVDGAMSASESYADALRVLGGMVDVVVTRTNEDLAALDLSGMPVPVINGGDASEHPTQALIELAAIERFAGPVAELRVALCGDLRMRAATSLLRLFADRPPARLSVIHPDGRGPAGELPRSRPGDLGDLDVLVMVGLPPGSGSTALPDHERARFALNDDALATLPDAAVVLSPMPVIDELGPAARRDPRLRMFEESDHGVFVRAAVVEAVLASR